MSNDLSNYRLGAYTRNVSSIPEQYAKWKKDPTPENYNALIQYLGSTITTAMQSFGSPDLRIRARILADSAIRSYNPSAGASLKSHVYNNLKGLQRIRADRQTATHIPENMRLNRMHVAKFEKDYYEKHRVMPSAQTTADHLQISPKAVDKAKSYSESVERTTEKGDSIVNVERSADDIWTDFVYHDVDDVNKKIMEWGMGYGGAATLKKGEIAKKLGITPAAVSSRIDTISRKMERAFDDNTGSM
jgi:DNA-directed RNA polymerase specialized sigma subunit